MRALVINPWIYDFAAYDLWSKPLGLFKLIHTLKRLNFEIDYIDCLDRFHPLLKKYSKPHEKEYGEGKYLTEIVEKPSIFKSIPRRFKRYGMPMAVFDELLTGLDDPDIIFINSGMTYWYPGPFEAIRRVKMRSSAPIVLGGVYALLCPDHAREKSGADVIFTSRDETTIVLTINKILKTKFEPFSVNGLEYYRDGYRLYPDLRYITLRTSKGCPYRCPYCGWYRIDSQFLREKPEEIINLIVDFTGRGVKNFAFYDDALLFEPDKHFMRIFEPISRMNLEISLQTPNGLHFEFVNKAVAKVMKRSGFVRPRLGFEDLKTKGRKISLFLKSVNNLLDAGYQPSHVYANILVGLPGQSVEDVFQTIDFVADLKIRIHLEEFGPVPGTVDFDRSGLDKESDPLLHNNTAYLLTHPVFRDRIDEIKRYVKRINRA